MAQRLVRAATPAAVNGTRQAATETDAAQGQDPAQRARRTGWTLLEQLALGDLMPAADLLDQSLAELAVDSGGSGAADASVAMLQTELELLHSELRVAQRRGQLRQPIAGLRAVEQVWPLVEAILPDGPSLTLTARFAQAPALGEQNLSADADPHIRMLRAALALMHRELSLAQRRAPLQRPGRGRMDGAIGKTADAEAEPIQAQSTLEPWQLDTLAMSQLGQDLWVLERTGHKQGGFFVEFGATDGVLLSNTWLLETYFGWRGLCAEPNPSFFPQLQANRRCGLSDQYIGSKTGEPVEFLLADVYGGNTAHADDDSNAKRRAGYKDAGCVQRMTAISLHDFLIQHQAPREIDYISIDTEGSEYEILSQFPFDQWQVRLFTIEHNFTKMREPIRQLMAEHGYVCTEAQWDDWFERSP